MSNFKQRGAVSLFVVIFATLLITVVTVSFLRLMINDQNQASSNDLSQSAYDSAQAGVEDAKRALLRYQKICDEQGKSDCIALADQISAGGCNDAVRAVLPSSDIAGGDGSKTGEVKVQQSSSATADAKLDQAYTCVLIKLLTDDYLGSLSANESKLVPLIGEKSFNQVTVNWFTTEDINKNVSGQYQLDVEGDQSPKPLYDQSSWPDNRPAVMRVQLMQFGSDFTLDSFDQTTDSGESNANTVFLYPTTGTTAATQSFTGRDNRKTDSEADKPDSSGDTPLLAHCEQSLSGGGYACSVTFRLPTPVGGGDRTAFLRLTPLYNQSHFQVTLNNGPSSTVGSVVKFNGVQPEVDSTGRANTLFRRVSSRVDLVDTSFPYPNAALELDGNLCKNFSVTPTKYYVSSNACTP